jgi:probable rRNA maturation factor
MVIQRQPGIRVSTTPLERFLARVRRELRLNSHEVGICLMSDAEIARLNAQYRGKQGPTDVLSFPNDDGRVRRERKLRRLRKASDSAAAGPVGKSSASFSSSASSTAFLGDIAISPATARRNARRLGRTLDDELRILILHGTLHLLGYDHETDDGQMERVERRLRRNLGLE